MGLNTVDTNDFKNRVHTALVQSSSDKRPLRCRKIFLFGIPIVVALSMGAGLGFQSTTMTNPHQLTQEQLKHQDSITSTIINHFGTFERVNEQLQLPSNQVTHDEDKVTAQTREIITDYGIFVKK